MADVREIIIAVREQGFDAVATKAKQLEGAESAVVKATAAIQTALNGLNPAIGTLSSAVTALNSALGAQSAVLAAMTAAVAPLPAAMRAAATATAALREVVAALPETLSGVGSGAETLATALGAVAPAATAAATSVQALGVSAGGLAAPIAAATVAEQALSAETTAFVLVMGEAATTAVALSGVVGALVPTLAGAAGSAVALGQSIGALIPMIVGAASAAEPFGVWVAEFGPLAIEARTAVAGLAAGVRELNVAFSAALGDEAAYVAGLRDITPVAAAAARAIGLVTAAQTTGAAAAGVRGFTAANAGVFGGNTAGLGGGFSGLAAAAAVGGAGGGGGGGGGFGGGPPTGQFPPLPESVPASATAATGAFNGLGQSMLVITAEFIAGYIAIKDFIGAVRDSIDAAAAQDAANVKLASQLQIQGRYNKDFEDSLHAQATALTLTTTATKTQITEAQALLATFPRLSNDVIPRATQAALDLAAALGYQLPQAARAVGLALDNPITGMLRLSRAGIQFTADQKAVVKELVETGHGLEAQQLILDLFADRIGGRAQAATRSFTGAVTVMRSELNLLAQALGDTVVKSPELTSIIQQLGRVFLELSKEVRQYVTDNRGLIEQDFKAYLEPIPGIVEKIATQMGSWADATLRLGQELTTLKTALSPITDLFDRLNNSLQFSTFADAKRELENLGNFIGDQLTKAIGPGGLQPSPPALGFGPQDNSGRSRRIWQLEREAENKNALDAQQAEQDFYTLHPENQSPLFTVPPATVTQPKPKEFGDTPKNNELALNQQIEEEINRALTAREQIQATIAKSQLDSDKNDLEVVQRRTRLEADLQTTSAGRFGVIVGAYQQEYALATRIDEAQANQLEMQAQVLLQKSQSIKYTDLEKEAYAAQAQALRDQAAILVTTGGEAAKLADTHTRILFDIQKEAVALRDAVNPQAKLDEQIAQIHALAQLEPTIITPKIEVQAVQKAIDDVNKTANKGYQDLLTATEKFGREFSKEFADALSGAKIQWDSLFLTLLKDIETMIIQHTFTDPLMKFVEGALVEPIAGLAGGGSKASGGTGQSLADIGLSLGRQVAGNFITPTQQQVPGSELVGPPQKGSTSVESVGGAGFQAATQTIGQSEFFKNLSTNFDEVVGELEHGLSATFSALSGELSNIFTSIFGGSGASVAGFFESLVGAGAQAGVAAGTGAGASSVASIGTDVPIATAIHTGGLIQFHTGGVVHKIAAAQTEVRRFHDGGVAAALYHQGGLKANEVPAILEQGELVIPKGMTQSFTQLLRQQPVMRKYHDGGYVDASPSVRRFHDGGYADAGGLVGTAQNWGRDAGPSSESATQGSAPTVNLTLTMNIHSASLDPRTHQQLLLQQAPTIGKAVIAEIERGGRLAAAMGQRDGRGAR